MIGIYHYMIRMVEMQLVSGLGTNLCGPIPQLLIHHMELSFLDHLKIILTFFTLYSHNIFLIQIPYFDFSKIIFPSLVAIGNHVFTKEWICRLFTLFI